MSETMHRRFLKEREAAQLLDRFSQILKINIKQLLDIKKPRFEVAETSAATVFFLNGKPILANRKDVLLPTLLFDKALMCLPKVTVNMGAVPHICNGADLMAPGVVKIEGSFNVDDYFLVVDERNRRSLAIAVALVDSQTALSIGRGKIAKNLHYVGDNLWNLIKKT